MKKSIVLSLTNINNQTTLQDLLSCNDTLKNFNISLSNDDAITLLDKMSTSSQDNGRLEFGGDIVKKIIYTFADSHYITQDNFVSTIYDLIEIFYYYKNETNDTLDDEELIKTMKNLFDNECEGSLDLLQYKELDSIAHLIKYGFDYSAFIEEKEDDE